MRIKEIGFRRDTIMVVTQERRGALRLDYWDFIALPSEVTAAIAFVQDSENAAEFRPQLDRLITAKRLFNEGFALLRELR